MGQSCRTQGDKEGNGLSSALLCQLGIGKVWRIAGGRPRAFREVAKMGAGHNTVQKASGGVISQAHVRDNLIAALGKACHFT